MLNQFLPGQIDNDYRGNQGALWIFGALLLMKLAMSFNTIFNGYSVATTADGVPLDSFPRAAAREVVLLVALWGLAHLMLTIIGVLALVRYRSMIPFLFALLLFEMLSRKAIHQFLPTVTVGNPPASIVNFVLLSLTVAGLALSLWVPGRLQADALKRVS
jgi:hypothetical protein